MLCILKLRREPLSILYLVTKSQHRNVSSSRRASYNVFTLSPRSDSTARNDTTNPGEERPAQSSLRGTETEIEYNSTERPPAGKFNTSSVKDIKAHSRLGLRIIKTERDVTSGQRSQTLRGLGLSIKTSGLQRWRKDLTTFEQLEYESDLGEASKPKVIDLYPFDLCLWMELVRFRRRIHDLEGIRAIWNRFRKNDIFLSHHSRPARKLWYAFLELGFSDHGVLTEMCDFILEMDEKYGGPKWPWAYFPIVGYFLRTCPREAHAWHMRLNGFPMSNDEVETLVSQIGHNRDTLSIFRTFYESKSETFLRKKIYSKIVPELCRDKRYLQAVRWHNLLITMGDLPANFSEVEPLLHLGSLDSRFNSTQLVKDMEEYGVHFADSIDLTKHEFSRTVKEIEAKFYPTKPKVLSDEFTARLFATRMIAVSTTINGLGMFGHLEIGPLSLREMGLRATSDRRHSLVVMKEYLEHLEQAGIGIKSSKFARLVQKLVEGKHSKLQAKLLYDVVTSDQHPDVLEDWKIQESLLASYTAIGDQRQINRTLAILSVDAQSEATELSLQQNALLRAALRRGDEQSLLRIVDFMQLRRIPMNYASERYIFTCFLSERGPGSRPTDTKNLTTLVQIWQGFMRSGSTIKPEAWVEVLRRLGMLDMLEQFEALSLWLADWYLQLAPRHTPHAVTGRYLHSKPRRDFLASLSREHVFRVLFPHPMQAAVIAWGFQFRHIQNLGYTRNRYPLAFTGQTLLERAQELAVDDSFWGLRLLVKLRDCGVRFNRSSVQRACECRIYKLFGFESRRRVNRVAQKFALGKFAEYCMAMELIWGNDLFDRVLKEDGQTEVDSAYEPTMDRIMNDAWNLVPNNDWGDEEFSSEQLEPLMDDTWNKQWQGELIRQVHT